MHEPSRNELATFGGGCFWCTQSVFSALRGVSKVRCGYAGGTIPAPSYEQVCTGTTGHAEVVQIEFDPSAISFADLLQVFFQTHDPTTPNRQGNDIGTQYRSVIFCHSPAQREAALATVQELTATAAFPGPIVTLVEPAALFYPAEDYHQDYFAAHPTQAYCAAVIRPKIEKFRKKFHDFLQS